MQTVAVDWWWTRIHSMELNWLQLIATVHNPSRTGLAMAPLVLWGWLMDRLMDRLIDWYFAAAVRVSQLTDERTSNQPTLLYYWIFYPQNILFCFQKKNAKMALKIFDFDFWSIIWFFFFFWMSWGNIVAFHAWLEPRFITAKSLKGKSTLISYSATDRYQFTDESISCIPKVNTF